jgi:hypothetical protein
MATATAAPTKSTTPLAPTPYDILWQGGLNFDGQHVVFDRQVNVIGADDHLWCDHLIGTLAARVQFGQRVDQQTARMAEVECRGNVVIDHLSRDAVGVTSHDRGQLARITINQQTGRITGDGPGVIRSTSSGDASQFGVVPNTAGSTIPPAANRVQLHYLRVDFQRGLDGNLYTKEIAFHDRVRTIYGPVDSWEQELDANRPETLPAESVTMSSDDLNVNEDPIAARNTAEQGGSSGKLGPVQMRATGSVQIDGQSPDQGIFAANSASASYEQAKELFILEGTDRQPATLRHQRQAGGQFITDTARRIQFNRLTGQVQQDGVHLFEFTPGDSVPAAAPQNARRATPRRQ